MTKSEQAARTFFTALDAGDVSRAASLPAPDVSLRFGNDLVIVGRVDVSAQLAELMSALTSLSHEVCTMWAHDDTVICAYDLSKFGASTVMYALRTHPVVIIGGLMQENPFYVDPDQFLREIREQRSPHVDSLAR